MWLGPTQEDNECIKNERASERTRDREGRGIQTVTDIDMNRLFQSAGVLLCSQKENRSALNSISPQWHKKSVFFREALTAGEG